MVSPQEKQSEAAYPIDAAYNNLKKWKFEKQADLFPIVLEFCKSPEKDVDKFFEQYAEEQELDTSDLKKPINVFKKIEEKQDNGLEDIAEMYKKEVVGQIYQSLHQLRLQQDLPDNSLLNKETNNDFDNLQAEDNQGIFEALVRYQEIKEKAGKIEKDPAFTAMVAYLQEDISKYGSLFLYLEDLAEDFDQDILADLIYRNELEKEQADLEPRTQQIEKDVMKYGAAYDDLKVIMSQQGFEIEEFREVDSTDKTVIAQANIGFATIEDSLILELDKIKATEEAIKVGDEKMPVEADDYKDLSPKDFEAMKQEIQTILEDIQGAKAAETKPVDFFNEDQITFLYWLLEKRANKSFNDSERLRKVSMELYQKYY